MTWAERFSKPWEELSECDRQAFRDICDEVYERWPDIEDGDPFKAAVKTIISERDRMDAEFDKTLEASESWIKI